MSLFGTIVSKIFGSHAQAAPASGTASANAGATQTGGGSGAPASTSSAPSSAGASTQTASAGWNTDCQRRRGRPASRRRQGCQRSRRQKRREARLEALHRRPLKVLDMDSSLSARKELAKELHYDGDTEDSATMNMWLSKQVMMKLAENGGKLPDDLKH